MAFLNGASMTQYKGGNVLVKYLEVKLLENSQANWYPSFRNVNCQWREFSG